jgi:hypothetical protein
MSLLAPPITEPISDWHAGTASPDHCRSDCGANKDLQKTEQLLASAKPIHLRSYRSTLQSLASEFGLLERFENMTFRL